MPHSHCRNEKDQIHNIWSTAKSHQDKNIHLPITSRHAIPYTLISRQIEISYWIRLRYTKKVIKLVKFITDKYCNWSDKIFLWNIKHKGAQNMKNSTCMLMYKNLQVPYKFISKTKLFHGSRRNWRFLISFNLLWYPLVCFDIFPTDFIAHIKCYKIKFATYLSRTNYFGSKQYYKIALLFKDNIYTHTHQKK